MPAEWEEAWDALHAATGLGEEDFAAFVQDCELEFGVRLPGFSDSASREDQATLADLQHLSQTLFDAVADPGKLIELSRSELLSRIGWNRRYEARALHEFPDPEIPYQPMHETLARFEHALSTLSGGYIGVFGTPGSGKSTFLTQTLRYRSERVIRYYAYVPDAQDPLSLRGESTTFLHCVALALSRAGFSSERMPPREDRAQLLERFHKQLALLHENWRDTGTKTVILVDGLDHIAREQAPGRSLLDDLPRPDQVPDGVYIVLGSQTPAVLPAYVQHSVLRSETRRVDMEPLSRADVLRAVRALDLSVSLSGAQEERVFEISAGHPLALVYLLRQVQLATVQPDVDEIMRSTPPYRDDIEAHYQAYWSQVADDPRLADFLGLICRLRRSIDPLWLEERGYRDEVLSLRNRLAHYFRIESPDHWYFFHNSFRLFLAAKTAEAAPGMDDPRREQAFHRRLADLCSDEGTGNPWSWEELYHRFSAGEHGKVLACAKTARLRDQMYSFRPLDAILTDARLAMRSAEGLSDCTALAELVLAASEFEQRQRYLEDVSHVPLLLQLGVKDAVLGNLRDGNHLRVSPTRALELCVLLHEADLRREAGKVFDLAEPLRELLTPISAYPSSETLDLLNRWAEVAPRFRPLEQVLGAIERIRYEERAPDNTPGTLSPESLRLHLLFHVGRGLLQAQQWDGVKHVLDLLSSAADEPNEWWFWLEYDFARDLMDAGEMGAASARLVTVCRRVAGHVLPSSVRVALAEMALRVLHDEAQARTWLEGVPQPDLVKTGSYGEPYLPAFLQRFRLNRLLRVFGDSTSLSTVVPDEPDDRNQVTVYFERSIGAVARIWGDAWRGRTLDPSTIVRDVMPGIRLFYGLNFRNSFYFVSGCRSEFYELLADAVSQHGEIAIRALRGAFEREWERQPTDWPAEVRRRAIMAFEAAHPDSEWAMSQLDSIEAGLMDGTVRERVAACREQAAARLLVGQNELARRALQAMLGAAFGVAEEKDYQFDLAVDWLGRINEHEPDRAPERIAWHCRAIAAMASTTDGEASRMAANNLISVAHRWSPRRAVTLLCWFLAQGLTQYDEAASALLTASATAPSTTRLAQSVFFDCVMPFSGEIDRTQAKRRLNELTAGVRPDSAHAAARQMVGKVDRYGLPSTRPVWRREIAEWLDGLGLDPESSGLRTKSGDASGEPDDSIRLNLGDGTGLTLREVTSRCATLAGATSLLTDQNASSYYYWGESLEGLIATLDVAGVKIVEKLVGGLPRATDVLSRLSRRLLQLGDRGGAWPVALRGLEAAEPYGWVSRYGGATRLMAAKAVVEADSEKGRGVIWRRLVGDLSEGSISAYEVATNLVEILPLLTSDVPTTQIYQLVDEYIQQLFSARGVSGCSVPSLEEVAERDDAAGAVADLLVYLLGHPVTALRQRAMSACVGLLVGAEETVQRALLEAMGTNENVQEGILMVLEGADLKDARELHVFRSAVSRLLESDNIGIRASADTLAVRLGCEATTVGRVDRPLRAIYRLAIRPDPAVDGIGPLPIPEGDVAPDSTEPSEIVRPFDVHLGIVATVCGLQAANLYYRAVEIMRELAPPQSWTADAERRLRNTLASVGLRYPYPRPRADLARRAMLHVVAELVDAGMLDDRDLRRLGPVLRDFDPYFLTVEPSRRPIAISPVFADVAYRTVDRDWLDRSEEHCDWLRLGEDRVVLAEETSLRRLFWETPAEVRQSVLLHQQLSSMADHEELAFGKVTNSLVSEYPTLQTVDGAVPVIVRHREYGYSTPGESWLALNPQLGTMMGWRLSQDGLFRWTDALGTVMVESIWWTEGLKDESPPHFDDEVGEGWLVVASPDAWRRLREELKELVVACRVTRGLTRDGSRQSGSAYRVFDTA